MLILIQIFSSISTGPGPVSPNRPAEDGQSVPTALPQHIRAGNVRQGLPEVGPGQGTPAEYEHNTGRQGHQQQDVDQEGNRRLA